MKDNNLDQLKSNLNNHHDSLTGRENQGNHFVINPPAIESPLITNAVHQSQNQGQQVPPGVYNNQSEDQSPYIKKQLPIDKKTLIKIGVIAGVIGVVVLGSWLGLRWYQRSSDQKILNEAARNLISAKDLHSKATIGVEGFALNFNIYVDKDQDIKATASIMGQGNAELIWFPSKDSAYAGASYNYYSENDEDKDKIEYIKIMNVKKTIEKYENEFALTDILNPTKDFFSGENMKYVERVGTDKIDGKKLHKFVFKPTKEFINEKVQKATKNKSLPFVLQKSDIEIMFWISDSDLKINKIDGKIVINIEASDAEKEKLKKAKDKCMEEYRDIKSEYGNSLDDLCAYSGKDYYKQELTLNWKQEFSYDFSEDIKVPDDAQITEEVDIYKELDQGYQNDKTKIADIKKIQKALKEYYGDKNYYPKELSQLEKENITSQYSNYKVPYLYSMPESPDDNKYIYETKGDNIQSYTLKVKLAAPDYYKESDYIKDGFLILTEDSPTKFDLEKEETKYNSTATIKARDAQRKADVRIIQSALTQYADDENGKYPDNLSLLIPKYLDSTPTDPLTGKSYAYSVSSDKTTMEINATLENVNSTDDENDGGNDNKIYEVGDDPGLDLI